MAKNKIAPQTIDEKSQVKAPKAEKADKQEKAVKAKKVDKKAKKNNAEPKRSRVKETFSELKKVTWPTFGKTMAQTGMVIGVVAIFAVLVFGVDALLSWLFSLINK